MITHSEHINEIAAALAKAQGSMGNATKDATNPAFRSKYADLASVRDAVTGPLSAAGIAVINGPATTAEGITVETMLVHGSGQWFKCCVGAVPKDYTPQSVGSAITYLRRYGLMALCNIAPDDDDGNAAQGHAPPPTRQQERPAPRPAPAPAPAQQDAPTGQQEPAAWTDAQRRAFMAEWKNLGLSAAGQAITYDQLAEWCEFKGRPRPSAMTPEQRSAMLRALMSPETSGKLVAFTITGSENPQE